LGIVPVKFISLTANFINTTSALIHWQIATPTINANYFEIEYSPNGINWQVIEKIMINNNTTSNYQYTHSNVPSSKLFYRIKQVDDDGKFIYSTVVLLRSKNNMGSIAVYPNPANTSITIVTTNFNTNTYMELFDAIGKKLYRAILTQTSNQINTSLLPNGCYVIKCSNANEVFTQKIIVKH
jgi:hypothetical protein